MRFDEKIREYMGKITKDGVKKVTIAVLKIFMWFLIGFSISAIVFGDGFPWHFVLCAAIIILWLRMSSRIKAFALMFGYYLGAAHDIPQLCRVFFGVNGFSVGFLSWMLSSLLLSLPWTVFWVDYRFYEKHQLEYYPSIKRRYSAMVINITLALLFVILPPIGTIGWANPIMGFAWLPFFSGLGYFGILLGILFTAYCANILYEQEKKENSFICIILKIVFTTFFALLFMFGHCPDKEVMNQMADKYIGVKAINTYKGKLYSGSDTVTSSDLDKFLKTDIKLPDNTKVVVLPETFAGRLNDKKEKILKNFVKSTKNKITLYIGGETVLQDGHYENGLYLFNSENDGICYRQRFPVPLSMWMPFSKNGCIADWLGSSIVEVGEQNAACLICYEDLLAYPILASFVNVKNRPTMILSVSNQWWSQNNNIAEIQYQSLLSWCRLFGVPAVTAENKAAKNK